MAFDEPKEMVCTWPDGDTREVMVLSNNGQAANVIWNEEVNTDCAVVTGFDETVPVAWLSDVP